MKLLKYAFLLIMPAMMAFAQDDDLAKLGFEEMPVEEESTNYFGIGIGPTINFTFLNFDDLNSFVQNDLGWGSQKIESPLFMIGGEVFSVPLLVQGIRLGFFWNGGSVLLDTTLLIGEKTYNRNLDYSLDYSGISIDYIITPLKSFAILPGVSLGWGGMSIEMYQGTDVAWQDVMKFQPDPNNFLNRAEASFIMIQPHVSFEYALTSYLAVRLNAAYYYTMVGSLWTDDWKFNNVSNLSGVPSGINNANAFNVSAGIFVGLFNY
jgi:hypothetical protein